MKIWETIAGRLAAGEPVALVTVAGARGSAPREAGARMIVRSSGDFHGTIGGGALEWEALGDARRLLATGRPAARLQRRVLGPDLGQCCGGDVRLLVEVLVPSMRAAITALAGKEAEGPLATEGIITAQAVDRRVLDSACGIAPARLESDTRIVERFDLPRRVVCLFGAGHVGRAVMLALAPLPFAVRWVDERANAFPRALPANVRPVVIADPATCLDAAPDGAFVVVMTHSHPRDFEIVAAALQPDRFDYVGLIGSASKRARFTRSLADAGIAKACVDRLACPIGIPSITSKHPPAIAAAVVAELLIVDERGAPNRVRASRPRRVPEVVG